MKKKLRATEGKGGGFARNDSAGTHLETAMSSALPSLDLNPIYSFIILDSFPFVKSST